MEYTVLRNGFRWQVKFCDLRSDDLVLATDQYFYPVHCFPELQKYFTKPVPTLADVILDVGGAILIGVAVVVILDALIGPVRNDEPLTSGIRNYVRERDGEICFYCDDYASDGHVDHRISRANGGSNDLSNLTWACISCNCSKGAMNDGEFLWLLAA